MPDEKSVSSLANKHNSEFDDDKPKYLMKNQKSLH